MRKRWFLVGMMFLLVPWFLVGCGVAQEQYDAVVAQLSGTQQELQSVKAELEAAQAKASELASSLEKARAEHEATQKELETQQAMVSELTSNLEKAKTEYEATQDDLKVAKEKLTEMNKVYPPRDFSSLKELQDWLLSNDVSERLTSTTAENFYSKALEVQEDAMRDGYIVSVDLDYDPEEELFYIACATVIDGDIWVWDPETDEPIQYFGLGKVK